MSEYQYYEFLAIDRPLTAEEQRELRSISTRADISATRFRNEYRWGDLKADPTKLLARYFDAHVYVTNWGVHRFALRFPRDLVDVKSWRPYCAKPSISLHEMGKVVLLSFEVHEEEPEFIEDADAHMPALASIRQMLLRGDLRALYLGWLASVQSDELRDSQLEPPVPRGLKSLSGPLVELCEFLFLDPDLLSIAIAESSAASDALTEGLADFIASLPEPEKNKILLSTVEGTETDPAARLLKMFRHSQEKRRPKTDTTVSGRSVGELLQRAAEVRSDRHHKEEEARRQAVAKAEREKAKARARYLDSLVGRQESTWVQIRNLIEIRQAKAYIEAISLLRDLSELAERQGAKEDFRERLTALMSRHQMKTAFLSRVKDAALIP
jgi:hypothetical protein